MPTFEFHFPLSGAVSNSDLCWHIRRGRLYINMSQFGQSQTINQPQPITFGCEPQFETIEKMEDSRFILCLVPHSWGQLEIRIWFCWTWSSMKILVQALLQQSPEQFFSRAEFWKGRAVEDIEWRAYRHWVNFIKYWKQLVQLEI